MDSAELLAQARRVLGLKDPFQLLSEAKEFLRVYAGPRSAFYTDLAGIPGMNAYTNTVHQCALGALEGFIAQVENDLLQAMSLERRAQIDVVSDFLQQAQQLLETKDVHPAAPAVLIGAALEEFLRNWVEAEGLPLGGKKPSLDAYSTTLREAELITKQDMKDITSWAGSRNHAAHGEWDEVSDRARIELMLGGVNLFMRKYGPQ